MDFEPKLIAGDLHPRQFATMADGAVITFAATVFEGDDLLVLALFDHFASDIGTRNRGAAVGYFVAVRVHEHVAKSHLLARVAFEQIHIDRVTFRDAILSAACFDNCVSHGLGKSRRKSHRPVSLTSGNPAVGETRRAGDGAAIDMPPGSTESRLPNFERGSPAKRDFALRRVRLIMREQFRGGSAPEFLEFLRQLARDTNLRPA